MVVVVEGAEALVAHDLEPKSLCDPLDGEVAEPLKLELIHHIISHLPFTISCAPVGAQASKLGVPFTIYGLRHRQRYRLRLLLYKDTEFPRIMQEKY